LCKVLILDYPKPEAKVANMILFKASSLPVERVVQGWLICGPAAATQFKAGHLPSLVITGLAGASLTIN